MRIFLSAVLIILVFFLNTSCSNENVEGFKILSIDKNLHAEMVRNNVFGDHSPISIERLKLIEIKYIDFSDQSQSGKIIVMDACAEQVKEIFIDLFEERFPVASVELMMEFKGSDSLSMINNNTSGHNLRFITGGKRLSLHAYGTAIDINPVNNPFINIPCDDSLGIAKFEPISGIRFANRMQERIGKEKRIGMAEEVIDIFVKHGFYWWGGYWDCPIDYQHFQISRSVSELLAAMKPDEAKAFFRNVQIYFNENGKPVEDVLEERIGEGTSLKRAYLENTEEFNKIISEVF